MAHMGEMRNANKIFVIKSVGKGLLGRHGQCGKIILKLSLRNYWVRLRSGFIWLWIRSNGGIL
jgi:hypothetical protein